MSPRQTSWLIAEGKDTTAFRFSPKLVEIIIFSLIPLRNLSIGGGADVPINEFFVMFMLAVAAFRVPPASHRRPLWFPILVCAVVGAVGLSAYLNQVHDVRRLGHLIDWAMLILFLSSGRIDAKSAARGLGIGLAYTMLFGLGSISSSVYTGRLSGVIGDPNAAGFMFVTVGLVAFSVIEKRKYRIMFFGLIVFSSLLTYSRTTLLALIVATAWGFLGRRLPLWGIATVAPMAAYVLGKLVDELKSVGPWADREGSDLLRERINVQENLTIDQSPWIGNGPGTAHVNLGSDQAEVFFFFHNSYLAMICEGGRIALTLFITLAISLIGRFGLMPPERRSPWREAAFIALLIVGMSLGEVFFAIPGAIVIGMTMAPKDPPPDSFRFGSPRG